MDRLITLDVVSLPSEEFLKELVRILKEEDVALLERVAIQAMIKRVCYKLNVEEPQLATYFNTPESTWNNMVDEKALDSLDAYTEELIILHSNLRETIKAFNLPEEEVENLVYSPEYMIESMVSNSNRYVSTLVAITYFLSAYSFKAAAKATLVVAAKTFPLLLSSSIKKALETDVPSQFTLVCAAPYIEAFLSHFPEEEESLPVTLLNKLLRNVVTSSHSLDNNLFKASFMDNVRH
tara:strand:+ start:631 stop:1341 length:711 start_codon:yes stop_codon:yes gene_type:complete